MRSFFSWICAAMVASSGADAWAQAADDKPSTGLSPGPRTNGAKALALREEGEAFSKANDCRAAVPPLRSAWALQEDAKTAVLLGECEVRLGHDPNGAYYLAQAMVLLPEGAERARVESILQDVSSRVARLEIVVNEPGAVVVVGEVIADTPVKALFVTPGEITIVVKKTGFGEQERKVTAKAGKTVSVEFTLRRGSNASDLDRPEKHRPKLTMIPAYMGVSAAILSIGIGIGLRVEGKNQGEAADAYEAKFPDDAASPEELFERCSTVTNFRRTHDQYVNASTGVFVTGGLLLGGSFVYGLIASRKTSTDVAIIPVVSTVNQGLMIEGRF